MPTQSERKKVEGDFLRRVSEKISGENSEQDDLIKKIKDRAVGSKYWKAFKIIATLIILLAVLGFVFKILSYATKNYKTFVKNAKS